jgi:hypothetical protein
MATSTQLGLLLFEISKLPCDHKVITSGAGGVAQVVEFLLSKREALSSTPILPKKKKNAQPKKVITSEFPPPICLISFTHSQITSYMHIYY